MEPIEQRCGPGLLKILSMGLIGGTAEDQAIMWRGLILNRAVQHFLEDVHWGDLDYLLIDMPPGTGDVQMGLARMLPRADMIIVTTPAAGRPEGRRQGPPTWRGGGYLRVAGVVENMTAFVCDHGDSYALFGSGGGDGWRPSSACRCSARCRSSRRWPGVATRAARPRCPRARRRWSSRRSPSGW